MGSRSCRSNRRRKSRKSKKNKKNCKNYRKTRKSYKFSTKKNATILQNIVLWPQKKNKSYCDRIKSIIDLINFDIDTFSSYNKSRHIDEDDEQIDESVDEPVDEPVDEQIDEEIVREREPVREPQMDIEECNKLKHKYCVPCDLFKYYYYFRKKLLGKNIVIKEKGSEEDVTKKILELFNTIQENPNTDMTEFNITYLPTANDSVIKLSDDNKNNLGILFNSVYNEISNVDYKLIKNFDTNSIRNELLRTVVDKFLISIINKPVI